MPEKNPFKTKNIGRSTILYDAQIISEPSLKLFDPEYHVVNDNQGDSLLPPLPGLSEKGIGRAKVVYFQHDNQPLVLKHYYRGGLVSSIIKDKYLGLDIEKTRAFKEWRLLKKMKQLDLPVPEAVAAHVEKTLFSFRADLITKELENAQTLADSLFDQSLDKAVWQKIGACIKLFHQHNVYHSDLNARNILLVDTDMVYLIDFDNSFFRYGSSAWKIENLARLKRSLLKFRKNSDKFCFGEDDWAALLAGYES